jgi:hypothetical protein
MSSTTEEKAESRPQSNVKPEEQRPYTTLLALNGMYLKSLHLELHVLMSVAGSFEPGMASNAEVSVTQRSDNLSGAATASPSRQVQPLDSGTVKSTASSATTHPKLSAPVAGNGHGRSEDTLTGVGAWSEDDRLTRTYIRKH